MVGALTDTPEVLNKLSSQEFNKLCKDTMRVLYQLQHARKRLIPLLNYCATTKDNPLQISNDDKTLLTEVMSAMKSLAEMWTIPQHAIQNEQTTVRRIRQETLAQNIVRQPLYRAYIAANLAHEIGIAYERRADDIRKIRNAICHLIACWSRRLGPVCLMLRMFTPSEI